MAEPSWKDSWRALAFGSSFAGIKKELSPAIDWEFAFQELKNELYFFPLEMEFL